VTVGLLLAAVPALAAIDGRAEFEARCSGCHPDGGNTINPAKALTRMSREANGIRSARDIVRKIRKPGPGMKAYDRKELSDKKAKAIAEYIISTFK
jgi:cytochrome c6